MNAPVSKRWTERHPQIRGGRRVRAGLGAGLSIFPLDFRCEESGSVTVTSPAKEAFLADEMDGRRLPRAGRTPPRPVPPAGL